MNLKQKLDREADKLLKEIYKLMQHPIKNKKLIEEKEARLVEIKTITTSVCPKCGGKGCSKCAGGVR